MIAYIRGEITEITETGIILETGGIGYEINMSATAVDRHLRKGQKTLIHTYFNVREDAMQLFGFVTKDDLNTFKLLLGVNGIGPKAALGILGGITPDQLRFAILSDDIKTISKAPGVGKKTAQKLILELKDKLSLADAFEQKFANEQTAGTAETDTASQEDPLSGKIKQEAVEALAALGYSPTEALKAVRSVPQEQATSVEALLKAALKYM